MGSGRDFLRVQYARQGDLRAAFLDFEAAVGRGEFAGLYYRLDARAEHQLGGDCRVFAHPTDDGDPEGHIDFNWATGESRIYWE